MDLKAIAARFEIPGAFVEGAPLGRGHINDTFVMVFESHSSPRRYVVQRINHRVFPDPVAVMRNIQRVLSHLQEKVRALELPDPGRRVLHLLPTRDGDAFWRDEEGEVWRCFAFIEGARSVSEAESPAQVREAARAFAGFQMMLEDLPGPRLRETIPGFHDTPRRWRDLVSAVESDPANRAAGSKAEIDFALKREGLCSVLLCLREAGSLRERVVHNDTKLNNVLLDELTGEGLCVIDLDTVMPGLSAWDFGDLARSAAHRTREDERDLSKVKIEIPLFQALIQGWSAASGALLTPAERDALVAGAKVITLECGLRFLADHLSGDAYFRVSRPGQNLDRCRVQWALLGSLEEREDELERIARGTVRR